MAPQHNLKPKDAVVEKDFAQMQYSVQGCAHELLPMNLIVKYMKLQNLPEQISLCSALAVPSKKYGFTALDKVIRKTKKKGQEGKVFVAFKISKIWLWGHIFEHCVGA